MVIPAQILIVLAVIFCVMQICGEIAEFKGIIVPEILKIRKYFSRRKQEKETIRSVPEALAKVQETLDEFNQHYSADRIDMRDKWIQNVNHKLEENDRSFKELSDKLDKNNKDTFDLVIESKRREILHFASYVSKETNPVTREQFNRIFKIHKEYEELIKEYNLTNGEVDIAFRIISESYENHLRNQSFIEDIRGY